MNPSKRSTVSIVLGLAAALPVLSAHAIILSAVNTGSLDPTDVYQVVPGGLQEDSASYIDRVHQYNDVPAYLLGLDYVKTANDDKTAANLQVALTTGPQAADIFLFLDNRLWDGSFPASMSWVGTLGFVDTGDIIGIDEAANGSIDNTSRVFLLQNVAPGTTVLLGQNDGSTRNMYGIAARSVPDGGAPLGMISAAVLALLGFRRWVV